MKSLKSGDDSSVRPPEQTHISGRSGDDWSAVIGNERLTALVSAILFVLILVELVTSASLREWLAVHIFVGVLLAGPLVVKVGSTFYRFLRYYTRAPAFVLKGPPRLTLRILGPLLLATTLVMIGSGIGLAVIGPTKPLLYVHVISALIWLPMIAIHSFAHIWQVLQCLVDDWRSPSADPTPGHGLRLAVNLSAILLGVIAALLLFPVSAPLLAWSYANAIGSGPFIVGMIGAALVLLVTRPLRWR